MLMAHSWAKLRSQNPSEQTQKRQLSLCTFLRTGIIKNSCLSLEVSFQSDGSLLALTSWHGSCLTKTFVHPGSQGEPPPGIGPRETLYNPQSGLRACLCGSTRDPSRFTQDSREDSLERELVPTQAANLTPRIKVEFIVRQPIAKITPATRRYQRGSCSQVYSCLDAG